MEEFTIRKPKGATKRKKIIGRGAGSGHGSTSGRGDKGQNARAGGGVRLGFEGGQMPLYRRIARRGFSNYAFKKKYSTVKLPALNAYADGSTVNRESLLAKGLIRRKSWPVKILGGGELTKKLEIQVEKVTAGARAKIEAAGGKLVGQEPGAAPAESV